MPSYYVYQLWTKDGKEGEYYAYTTIPVRSSSAEPTPIGESRTKLLTTSPEVMDEEQLADFKKRLINI